MRYVVGTVVLCIMPFSAHAAVLINEVAWMGTESSANDEWIELHNTGGSSVSLDGWVLTDGEDLDIMLSGTVPAGGYALLERTDDSSAPGSAFLIYTGALTNDGRTLTLLRADGTIEDQVGGGENWEHIGGDNETKETAQYTESGWTTGSPTPGAANVAYAPPAEEDESEDTDTSDPDTATSVAERRSAEKEVIELVLPDVTLGLELSAQEVAYVHEPVTFSVESSGISEGLLDSVRMSWNFGDLTTATGRSVTHVYQHPGTYVVVVGGEYKRHHATARHEVTVLPVTFSLTRSEDGDLQIHNDAKYEVDLSGYSVRGEETVVFPENTILLPNATITIPADELGGAHAWLMD